MNKLFQYIFFQVLHTTIMVTVILLAVVWLSQSLKFVDLIVNQGLDIGGFLRISVLLMPSFLVLILPVSCFVAVAMVYVRLYNERELIVMRASGLGQLSIMAPALGVGAFIVAALYSINLYFLPAGYQQFKNIQYELQNDLAGLVVREGSFNSMSDDLTVYIRNRDQFGTFFGLLLHESQDPNAPVTTMAERGTLIKTPDGPRFVLEKGNRQYYNRTNGQLDTLYFERYVLDLSQFNPATLGDRWRKSTERFVGELLNPDMSNASERKNAHKFKAEGHSRLAWPLYPIPFVLLAGAAVLGGNFNRRGTWARLLPLSICFGLSLFLGISLQSIVAQNINLVFLLYTVPMLSTVFALWALYQKPQAWQIIPWTRKAMDA